MKKILALGYIPKGRGGKQETGLATGIFDLHNAINQINKGFQVIIAATDIHEDEIQIDNTKVVGWNWKKLVIHIIKNPVNSLKLAIYTLKLLKYRPVVSFFNTFFKLIFFDYSIQKINPDYLQFHGAKSALYSVPFRKNGQKSLLRLHGINGYDKSISHHLVHRQIEKDIVDIPFDIISFVTNRIRTEWNENFGNFSTKEIPVLNGYDKDLFYPIIDQEKEYDLITISGISERKGQLRVVKAIAKLKKEKNSSLSYLIIGSGDQKIIDEISRLKNDHDLDINTLGFLPQEELNKYLNKSKYFILPSITEGFGKVYIESIGSGTPVIIPEHLPLFEEIGILTDENSVPIKDYSIDSIKKGLELISNREYCYKSNVVSSTVENLNWKQIANEYIAEIQKLND